VIATIAAQRIESMKRHHLGLVILAAAAVVLVAGHGFILYLVSSHIALSATAVSGVVILVVLKHLGLLSPLYALFRRRSRPNAR
jgi:hypothetical protein